MKRSGWIKWTLLGLAAGLIVWGAVKGQALGTMRKAIRSVSRCDYDIRIEEGAEGSEAA